MKIEKIIQLKSKFVSRKVDDELVIVPLAGNIANMDKLFTLNETGSFLWDNLEEKSSEDALVDALTSEFDIDSATAKKDVAAFLEQLSILDK